MTAPILLSTLNARYTHASFGLRYLAAAMSDLSPKVMEFDINQRPIEIAEKILNESPALLGLGIYVWNARQSLDLIRLLKKIRPTLPIVLGGPEVSHETEDQEICHLADLVITGEADLKAGPLFQALLQGTYSGPKFVASDLPDVTRLASPYSLYTAEDIANRVVYVEASRGCPFHCEFCLSSLDIPVRQFPLDRFLADMEQLLQRGLRQIKFVDRTFNLNLRTSLAILDFFYSRYQPGLFLHFEMIPDRFPDALRESLTRFPPGAVQLEAGIQTFDPETSARINRRQDYERIEENLKFLRQNTGAHLHVDLIAGLPGETIESFGLGFDRLVAMNPQEIQVGILKRLRGAPISKHTAPFQMVYDPVAPYELLQNSTLDFFTMQQLRRFAKYWDLVVNSGNFNDSVRLLWAGNGCSAFYEFLGFTNSAFAILKRTDSISLSSWTEVLLDYLTTRKGYDRELVRNTLLADFERAGRREIPAALGSARINAAANASPDSGKTALPKRQQRHSAGA